MNLEQLRRNAALIARTLRQRIEVYRVLISPVDKRVIKRIYRGSFIDKHRPQNSERHSEGEHS